MLAVVVPDLTYNTLRFSFSVMITKQKNCDNYMTTHDTGHAYVEGLAEVVEDHQQFFDHLQSRILPLQCVLLLLHHWVRGHIGLPGIFEDGLVGLVRPIPYPAHNSAAS